MEYIDEEDDVYSDAEEYTDYYQDIELLPHQKKIIKYMVSKCRKQHGMLVNHNW